MKNFLLLTAVGLAGFAWHRHENRTPPPHAPVAIFAIREDPATKALEKDFARAGIRCEVRDLRSPVVVDYLDQRLRRAFEAQLPKTLGKCSDGPPPPLPKVNVSFPAVEVKGELLSRPSVADVRRRL